MRYFDHVHIGPIAMTIGLLLSSCTTGTAAPIRQGDIAPAVAMTTLVGERLELSPQAGQMIWLNFWASWCRPCQAEWPGLNQAQQDLAGEGLRLVAISVNEQPDKVQAFLAAHPAAFAVALDPHGELAARFAVAGFPTHVLIDKAGIVRAIVRGPLDERRARRLLELGDGIATN
jgi:thiol-disulfide isomerase/thioredoxin